jgi:hypothetical protein
MAPCNGGSLISFYCFFPVSPSSRLVVHRPQIQIRIHIQTKEPAQTDPLTLTGRTSDNLQRRVRNRFHPHPHSTRALPYPRPGLPQDAQRLGRSQTVEAVQTRSLEGMDERKGRAFGGRLSCDVPSSEPVSPRQRACVFSNKSQSSLTPFPAAEGPAKRSKTPPPYPSSSPRTTNTPATSPKGWQSTKNCVNRGRIGWRIAARWLRRISGRGSGLVV